MVLIASVSGHYLYFTVSYNGAQSNSIHEGFNFKSLSIKCDHNSYIGHLIPVLTEYHWLLVTEQFVRLFALHSIPFVVILSSI